MAKRVIAVAGATGNQGGSVLKALANHPQFEVRALTRNTSKPAATALLQYGSNITLQECDLNNAASLSSALKGAYGFFSVTNYFAHKMNSFADVKEEEEGKLIAKTAKEAGVKHFIFSTLPETKERSGGKYQNVYHFDGKWRIEQYARTLGFEIESYVAPSCYLQNFAGAVARLDKDGTVVFALAFPSVEATLPVCDIEHDMGVTVKAIFEQGPKANKKLFPLVSEFIKFKDIAAGFTQGNMSSYVDSLNVVTGKKARVELIPKDAYIANTGKYMGEFVATDLWEMFHAFADIGFGEAGEPQYLNNTKELGVHLNTWVEFLKNSGWQGPQ